MDQLKSQEYINDCIIKWMKDDEIFQLLNFVEQRKNEKNRKTNQRRNQLRKENGKSTKRWSKGYRHSSEKYWCSGEVHLMLDRIMSKIMTLLDNGNIIYLFELYWIRLRETYNLYIGLCPFHQENTPSFVIGKNIGVAKCFGCGQAALLVNMLFRLRFGHKSITKISKLKEIESEIDQILLLDPINKYTKEHRNQRYKQVRDVVLWDSVEFIDDLPF